MPKEGEWKETMGVLFFLLKVCGMEQTKPIDADSNKWWIGQARPELNYSKLSQLGLGLSFVLLRWMWAGALEC